uniref:hypothetical protein n=1 Tax=Synarthrophyton patena TaxID=48972 RepID=UPI002182496B|nr:hypothetical protein N4M48_pgp039 [Synarthrophyton patena]UVF62982.1 hypothetical protein [Synarthrophyton patena]
MLLFNLIFAHSISKSTNYLLDSFDSPITLVSNTENKKERFLSSLPFLISMSDSLTETKNNLANKKLISGNFLTRFINNFWQQTVFLSVPTKLSDKYISQLNSLNLVKNPVRPKKILSQFSQSLMNDSINSSLSSNFVYNNQFSSIKYIWKKSRINLNWTLLNKDTKFLDINHKQLFDRLQINNLPLFIVTNHLNQMIVAELPKESKTSFIFKKLDLKSYYQAWFFINYQDAEEYLQYIKNQYEIIDANNQLRIFICNLETFYKLSNKCINTVQFRLVPDLHEIGELVNTYSSYRNIIFNKAQNYGKDYFQGQPIYILKNDNYYYQVNELNNKIKYQPVFMTYKTAVSSYKHLVKKQNNSKSLKPPKLMVYNLEEFLEKQVASFNKSNMPFLLIPSKSSYKLVKSGLGSHILYDDISIYVSQLKLWTKRILWSLTSRQPQDW